MKKLIILSVISMAIVGLSFTVAGCSVSKKVADKSGAQLWAENCNRCHNAPGPGEFSNANWEIVGTHMQIRANLTQTDVDKVIDFMKAANN